MKILIVGLGSIAVRHIKNIKDIDAGVEIAIYRQHSRKSELGEIEPLVENVVFSETDAVNWRPDVTFITNPASMHCETALLFAKNNSHLFIEKPLSVDISGLSELLKETGERNLKVMVGYSLRFFKPLQIVKNALEQKSIGKVLSIRASVGQNLLNWRPDTNYQDSVSARKALGGGVLFELSHELDYVRWLVGEITQIWALSDKVSDLEIDVEDIAEICLKFSCGAIGNIHLDMIDHAANRSCRIVGTKGTLIWDLCDDNSVKFYSSINKEWVVLRPSKELDKNKMYIEELKHFFSCIKKNKEPLVSIKEGRRIVELIMAAKNSVEKGESVLA